MSPEKAMGYEITLPKLDYAGRAVTLLWKYNRSSKLAQNEQPVTPSIC